MRKLTNKAVSASSFISNHPSRVTANCRNEKGQWAFQPAMVAFFFRRHIIAAGGRGWSASRGRQLEPFSPARTGRSAPGRWDGNHFHGHNFARAPHPVKPPDFRSASCPNSQQPRQTRRRGHCPGTCLAATRCGLGQSALRQIRTSPFFVHRLFRNPHAVERAIHEDERDEETNPADDEGQMRVGMPLFHSTAISTASRPKSVVNLMMDSSRRRRCP